MPYDYTVEVTNRLKGLDLIDTVPEDYGRRLVTLYRRQGSRPSARKESLNDLDNHDDVVIHIKPDILECELTWASESITMNKAGGDEIPYDYSVEVTNRFKGFNVIECLKNYGWRFVTLYKRQ